MGSYQLQSISLQCASAAIRAATTTVTNWRYWFEFLSNAVFSIDVESISSLGYHSLAPPFWDSVPFGLALPASNLVSGSVINLEFSIIHVLYGNKNFLNDSQTKNIVKKSGVIPYLNPRSWDIAEILLPRQRSCNFQKRF